MNLRGKKRHKFMYVADKKMETKARISISLMKYIGNIWKGPQFMNNPISAGLKQTKSFCSIPVFLYGQWKRQASPRTNSDWRNLSCHDGTLLFLHWLQMESRATQLGFKLI